MIQELVEMHILPGHEDDFVRAVAEARPLFEGAAGCHGLTLTRSVEQPSLFRLLVRWDSVEEHMDGFRNSPAFAEWRRLGGPHFAQPPHVEHLETVLA